MGPFKRKLAVSQNDWLINHPGKTITIQDLADIVTTAYNASFTPNNITSGFKRPGIFPFSRNAFTDDDFDCSEVTNRPILAVVESLAEIPVDRQEASQEATYNGIQAEEVPGLSDYNKDKESFAAVPLPEIISPEMVRPYPKADARKEGSRERKKGKPRIVTETLEKMKIEAAYLERQKRLQKSGLKKRKPKFQVKRSKTLIPNNSSDDAEDDAHYSVHSATDLDLTDEDSVNNDDDVNNDNRNSEEVNIHNINPGDFYLVRCSSENNNITKAFVAKVEEKLGSTVIVNFLKKKPGFIKFFFSEKEDKWPVSILDILAKLPPPTDAGSTSRTARMVVFHFDFIPFKLG